MRKSEARAGWWANVHGCLAGRLLEEGLLAADQGRFFPQAHPPQPSHQMDNTNARVQCLSSSCIVRCAVKGRQDMMVPTIHITLIFARGWISVRAYARACVCVGIVCAHVGNCVKIFLRPQQSSVSSRGRNKEMANTHLLPSASTTTFLISSTSGRSCRGFLDAGLMPPFVCAWYVLFASTPCKNMDTHTKKMIWVCVRYLRLLWL